MNYRLYLLYFMWWLCILLVPSESMMASSIQFEDTSPQNVEISGMLNPPDNRLINDEFDATILLFNSDQSVPTVSFEENIRVINNYFRTHLDLKSTLIPFYDAGKQITVKVQFSDDLFTELPIATIPTVIKSAFTATANQMMDNDLIFFDYDNSRIGIRTTSPQATVDVNGTVQVTDFFYGDGSQLTNIGYKGKDNYNYLRSENGEFLVVTVNIDGQIVIGGRSNVDPPFTDLTVYGSLLVEPNNMLSSEIISGSGARWMWFSERDVLRIGYVPSFYWDDDYSGDHSVAFGYATMAKGHYSVVTGGYYNEAKDQDSIIAGGTQNLANGKSNIIIGGENNIINQDDSIILGGKENVAEIGTVILGGVGNFSSGPGSMVSGFNNTAYNQNAIVFGGKQNEVTAENSIAFGKMTRIKESARNSVGIGFSDNFTNVENPNSIQINVENGFGIGTADTTANQVVVNGIVSANYLIGDASLITNIRSSESAFRVADPNQPNMLVHDGRMGIGTSNLIESLNVSGSIQLSGDAEEEDGTIRYLNDTFSVYKNGNWVSLQMKDTDTTYNASSGLSLHSETNTFDLVTTNATIGQVLIWDGEAWGPSFLDQFIEQPVPSRLNDLSLSKRLYLPDGNVIVNRPDSVLPESFSDVPFTVYADDNQETVLYMVNNTDQKNIMSFGLDNVGVYFQGYYNKGSFFKSDKHGGGFNIDNNTFVFNVDDKFGNTKSILKIDKDAIRINDDVSKRQYPFFVGGTIGSATFLLDSDDNASGLYVIDDYYRNCSIYDYSSRLCFGTQAKERSVVFEQLETGELTIQSGAYSGDIVFNQAGQQVGRLHSNRDGNTAFGITPRWLRSELDVYGGHVHVTDGYGIGFYNLSNQLSGMVFRSSSDNRFEIFTDEDFINPNLAVSITGNVAINSIANKDYDLYVSNHTNSDMTSMRINAGPGRDGMLRLRVNEDMNVNQYQVHLKGDQLVVSEGDELDQYITVDQNGFVGINDDVPAHAISISGNIVLLNQSGIYFNESGNASDYPALEASGNVIQFGSSDHIRIKNKAGNNVFDIEEDGVAINTLKSVNMINSQEIGFEVNGTVVVSGDIYNTLDDKIFPLDVKNDIGAKQIRRVKTIRIDTDSGLFLNGTNTPGDPLKVSTFPFYNRIKVPSGEILRATGNMDLRLIGRGITILGTNINERAEAQDIIKDTLSFQNDLISGGLIDGDLNIEGDLVIDNGGLGGDASGIRNIPFNWQQVTRNNAAIPDPPDASSDYYDEGEIYFDTGKVGINTTSPKTLLEVVGTAGINELLVRTELRTASLISTSDLNINSQKTLTFKSPFEDITIGRNGESIDDTSFDQFLKVTHLSQLLFDTDASSYLVDMGRNNSNLMTEFLIDNNNSIGNNSIYLDFKRSASDAFFSIRYDDTGTRYSDSFLNPNIQIESNKGLSFFTNGGTLALKMNPNGQVGIFESNPKNTLDVNGNMSIGYSESAPVNSLIVKNNVGVGLTPGTFPRSALEVSGSVLVGTVSNSEIPSGLYVKNDGTSKLLIGGLPKINEQVFVKGDMSIKNGRLTLRDGNEDGLEIIRDTGSSKNDFISQLRSGFGLDITSYDDISFKTYDSVNTQWQKELVLDTNGNFGVGGDPETVLHVMDEDDSAIVTIQSGNQSKIHLQYGNQKAVIGTDRDGLKFKTHSNQFVNAELIIANDSVGINDEPKSGFDLHVNGNLNATNYKIKDQFSSTGYRDFQSVPTGVVILWLEETIPAGWEICNGSNGCPNMAGKYVKGVNSNYSNLNSSGGTHQGVLSETTHDHSTETHHHYLSGGAHEHSFEVKEKTIAGTTGFANAYKANGGQLSPGYRQRGYSYTVLNDSGSHTHSIDNTHAHNGSTFTGGDHSGGSGNYAHGSSGNESHLHDENSTVGTGSDAKGTNGNKHQHRFDNRPKSKFVRFIVKVNET